MSVPEGPSNFNWSRINAVFRDLRDYRRVFYVICGAIFVLAAVYYAQATPKYTARAVIGPPSPSPSSSMMASQSGGAGATGLTRRLLAGGGGSGNDPFQEYLQLLGSARLLNDLVEKDHILQRIYPKRWDAKNNRWYPPGLLGRSINEIKKVLGRPVSTSPTVEDLRKYMMGNFAVAEATSLVKKSSLLNSSSPYVAVTFSYKDREVSQDLLNTILNRADNIIREETAIDVNARITYLHNELPNITQAEQRESLIAILTSQEELQMMLNADHRYASTMIDPAYVPPEPTSPPSPIKVLLYVLMASFAAWFGTILLAQRVLLVRNGIRRFGPRTA